MRGRYIRAIDNGVESLLAAASDKGWVTSRGVIEDLIKPLQAVGYELVPTRPGDPLIAELVPRSREAGRKRSLSALHGRDSFPLHTDGAHIRRAPDYILLEHATSGSSGTNTLLHRIDAMKLSPSLLGDIDHGVFLAANGRASFLVHARDKAGRVRFDPGCMRPLDDRARRVASHFLSVAATAVRHSWSYRGELLVIDNTAVLHGRSSAPADDGRVLRQLLIRRSRG